MQGMAPSGEAPALDFELLPSSLSLCDLPDALLFHVLSFLGEHQG